MSEDSQIVDQKGSQMHVERSYSNSENGLTRKINHAPRID